MKLITQLCSRCVAHRMTRFMVATLSCFAAGCAASTTPANGEYRTVATEPRRDTERAKIQNGRAIELIGKNKWDEAEAALKSALVADVTFGPAHNNLGRVYFQKNQLYQAAWEFQYAIRLMPDQPEPHNNLGLVLEASGKLDDAIKCDDEALALDQENPQNLGNNARARVRRGDRDAKVSELLSKLLLHDNRPEWSEWAREQFILLNRSTPSG